MNEGYITHEAKLLIRLDLVVSIVLIGTRRRISHKRTIKQIVYERKWLIKKYELEYAQRMECLFTYFSSTSTVFTLHHGFSFNINDLPYKLYVNIWKVFWFYKSIYAQWKLEEKSHFWLKGLLMILGYSKKVKGFHIFGTTSMVKIRNTNLSVGNLGILSIRCCRTAPAYV